MMISLKAVNLTIRDGSYEVSSYGHLLYKKDGVVILVMVKKPSDELIELEISVKRKKIYLNNLILTTNNITISNDYLDIHITINK